MASAPIKQPIVFATMQGKVTPGTGIVILLGVATTFAANHVAARIAFDHGASVATGVVARAAGTALVLLVLMKIQSVTFSLPRELRGQALLAGVLVAVQSYCLYSAVALIPAALALLVFQTCPMLFVLLSWAMGKEAPRPQTFAAMLLALAGLALALDVSPEKLSARWTELGAGVSWAFGGAVSFAFVYYMNSHSLKAVDGRVRTFVMTAVTAVLVLAGGAAGQALSLPQDNAGWLGLALLTVFYCIAMSSLFVVLPRLSAASTGALNFEPIALLALAWIFLGQAVTPLQIVGAFVTVGAIVWLGVSKK
jgi:drug/metabolite transporter (DMT)-like permease